MTASRSPDVTEQVEAFMRTLPQYPGRPTRQIILLYAGNKAGAWNDWYRRAIPEAARLYRDYLATTNQR